MHARKIRYDDAFIANEKLKKARDTSTVTSVTDASTGYASSPARQLQQQLEAQYLDTGLAKPVAKYSGLSSLSIIVGSSIILWAGLIALGLFVAQ